MAIAVQTVNGFPYWSQVDYGGVISSAGCAPTASAMVLKALGKDVDPEKLCNQCSGHGWSSSSGAQKEILFPYISKLYGVPVETVTSFEKCCEYAKQGYPIILDGRKDPGVSWSQRCMITCYGPAGHYVVLVGMNGNDVVINDPRGIKYSGIRPRSHASDGFICGFKLGNTKFNLDSSKFKKLGEDGGEAGYNGSGTTVEGTASSGSGGGGGTLEIVFHDTTTVQESLPNANVSDNWVDMHKIKGITLHMYPPYHNCTADSMAKYFKSLGWNRNFHYKVDEDTKIDFDKKPVSGQTTGGNVIGSSLSDFEVTPKDPLYTSVVIGGGGAAGGQTVNGSKGTTTPEKIYELLKSNGFTDEAAAGVIGNCECESHFDSTLSSASGGTGSSNPAMGLFQWLKQSDRFKSLESKAKAVSTDWTNVDVQIKHMYDELMGEDTTCKGLMKSRYGSVEAFKNLTDAYEAGYYFGKFYERGLYLEKRAERAKKWLELIKSKNFSKCADGDSLPASAIFSSGGSSSGGGGVFGWPIPGVSRIPSGGHFGASRDGGTRLHKGIDISCAEGTKIQAYADGKVVTASYGYNSGRGNYVRIEHETGCYTWYEHIVNNGIKVKVGDTVKGGDVIALVGNTGHSFGAHLHFEIWKNNTAVDPLLYVKQGGGYTSKATATSNARIMMALFREAEPNPIDFEYEYENENDGPIEYNIEPFGWPLPNDSHIQSYYGYRAEDLGYNYHPGIDIMCYEGSGVYCYTKGTVEKVLIDTKLNGYVRVNHGNGLQTVYGSLGEIYVKEGDIVFGGQCLGTTSTTMSNGLMHLHFEILIDGKQVDPLLYVNPEGGNVDVPDQFYSSNDDMFKISLLSMSDTSDNITWDNVDKGKICFASADNNTHTYIDANLFNNQHPKYTLSIGSFFYNEFNMVEKTGKIDYAKTEKKLIQQCAKALYDEGFTSKELWREFDLNRAPSPFLYLDRDLWEAFCKEVDKQIDWLNTKYGKVTATYIPNNLLTNTNTNQFIETAPSVGGSQDNTNEDNSTNEDQHTTTIMSMSNGIFIGDGWVYHMGEFIKADGGINEGVALKDILYFYDKSKNVDRLKNMEKNPSFIFIYVGRNKISTHYKNNFLYVTNLLDRARELWPDVPIFYGALIHSARNFKGIIKADTFNTYADKFNKKVQEYSEGKNIYSIDISSNLLDSNGYLKSELATSDGFDLKKYDTFYNNIRSAIFSTTVTVSNNAPTESYITDENTLADTTADIKNIGKYCFVGDSNPVPMYKKAKADAAQTVTGLAMGDELKIVGASGVFYVCEFGNKTGYVKANVLSVIGTTHGEVHPAYVNRNCFIKFEGTELYTTKEMNKVIDDLEEQCKGVITNFDTKLGLYQIVTDKGTGWIKAYTLTFDPNYFKVEIDNTTNVNLVGNTTEEPSNTTNTNIDINCGDFEDNTSLGSWQKEGTFNFLWIKNPDWATEGHWPYRGKGFARIKNNDTTMAGIKQDITIPKSNKKFSIRILFWVKQVTQEDAFDGPPNPDTIKENGIFIKLLDKNKKVKHEKKISLTGIKNTTWSRVGCVINNTELESYTLFIGNNKKFDLFIDDVTIEQITDVDDVIGESDSSSGLIYSGLGASSIDNGGVMIYEVGKPTNKNAVQPAIKTIVDQDTYEKIMEYSDPKLIDNYTNSFEPYDKDLTDAKNIGLTDDVRFQTLTEEMKTFTDNIIRYKVVETGPGSVDHCVKPVDELNVLYKNVDCKVDPIYPDLVIPPKYTTSTYDSISKNSLPLSLINNAEASLEDALDKSYSYDYKLLDKKTKKSKGKPTNYYDPYPFDDKIAELENHYPKVLIDEIESRLYTDNHPGSPIAHPIAKNFAMLNDMSIRQSKATEQRLVKLENILSTMIRCIGRLGSRMNINCVYYGGQTVLGKYKCVRCLRDDRLHDGATVTIDQCLNCTRYEPIIGQIYDILDETGFNGSAILDDMQMSYMSLDDFKNLNLAQNRSTEYKYVDANKKMKSKPKDLIEEWKAEDEKEYIKTLEEKYTNKKDLEEAKKEMKPSDYLFIMDWMEEDVDLQRPDVKVYPTEKISAKYYNQAGDPGEKIVAPADESTQMGTDKDTYQTIASGNWIDTRKIDDSYQTNKYTSLDFYFENFNLNRTGYEYDNGLKGNIGLTYTGGVDTAVNGKGTEIRNKIIEYAYKVVQENKDAKSTYSNSPRTVDPNNIAYYKGTLNGCSNPACYDCSSLVSSAYKYAGLSCFYDKSCAGGTLVSEAIKTGSEIWLADKAGFEKAIPGDIIMVTNSKISNFNPQNPPSTHHVMIYTAANEVSHASKPAQPGESIRTQSVKYDDSYYGGKMFFIRAKELIDADSASNSAGTGISEVAGTVDGINYVCKLGKARCTEYGPWDGSTTSLASGAKWSNVVNKAVASHNLPYGTTIYIPDFKGKVNSTGLFTVEDTGGHCFDFDLAVSSPHNITGFHEAYIVSYGTSKTIAASFTKMYNYLASHGGTAKYQAAFNDYMKNGGCLIKFSKFNSEDANATWWKK